MTTEIKELNLVDFSDEIRDCVKEASNVLTQIDMQKANIADIRKRAKDEFGMKPKVFNDLLRLYHNQSRDEFENKHTETVSIYDTVFTHK